MGLMAVKAHGGVTIVQDPREASHSGMPEHALHFVEVDHVLPVRAIARAVVELARAFVAGKEEARMEDADERVQKSIHRDFVQQVGGARAEEESVYTCPECGGVLWQSEEDRLTGFRCYLGHTYAPERLLMEKTELLEDALWSATRALVERATLNRQLARQLRERGVEQRATHLEEQADRDESHIRLLRSEVLQADGPPASRREASGVG
jgi:two-component system chemotaxis response regulator CheB